MGSNGETNGADRDPFQALADLQRERFGSLEHILERGFDDVASEIRGMRGNLIEALTGKKQVPLPAFILTQVVWAILCLLLLVKVTSVDLKLNWNEIHAKNSQGKENDRGSNSKSN